MAAQKKKIVFMGTPEFAAVVLRHLLAWPDGEVVAVYTQPDRPCGRGRKCRPSAVKTAALEKGLAVYQPQSFKDEGEIDNLRDLNADYLAVAAYGLILPRAVLDASAEGAYNVHASLLPKYRGAAPIQRAILNGEWVTGITIMRMDEGMDTGDILLQRSLAIGIDDTAETVHDQLADMGGRLLVKAFEDMREGRIRAYPQPEAEATYAPKLEKKEGLIDWDRPAKDIHNQIRGMHPWPGAYFVWPGPDGDVRLGLYPGRPGPDLQGDVSPGDFLGLREGDNLAVACRDREYWIPWIKPSGSKPMTGRGFYCGYLSRCA
jgi:methionyl-tRNA formyltransferase